MSSYTAERIDKPRFFGIRPTIQGRGKRTPYVIGFDTEGDHSRPFLMQFSEGGTTEDETVILEVPEDDHAGIHAFMTYIIKRVMPRHFSRTHEVVIYGFNLTYEWTQLFHDLDEIKDQDELTIDVTTSYEGHDHKFKWTVYNDKRVFAKIEHPATKLVVRVLDAQMFYKTSLDNAARMLGLGEKYAAEAQSCGEHGAWHESGHDRSRITRELAQDPEFLLYARRDAYITRLVGEQIISLHEEYDIRQTISAPHFASSVFKRRFLETEVELPVEDLEQAGLWSYHGGKNGFYLPGPSRMHAWQYDITSAYPEAMRQLPDIEQASWDYTGHYEPGVHAIWRATLEYRRCPWRGMMLHDGSWPPSGRYEDVCLTSYELDAMVERGEAVVHAAAGWIMRGPAGGPLLRFVDTFFAQKARTTGAERETAKLLLNSLYGKFFQKVALGRTGAYDMDTGDFIVTDPTSDYDFRAGGLYHPPIASLITGFVRARIHGLEHKYQSVMTSTDGIFGQVPPDPTDIGKHLGGLTAEEGELRIWRERLYIFNSSQLPKPKVAYHGFWGSQAQLEALPLAAGTYSYTSRHMVTLKESLHRFDGRRHEPGSFIDVQRTITL